MIEDIHKLIPVRLVIEAVSEVFEIPVAKIVGDPRDRPIVNARFAAMWIMREDGRSFPLIGRAFGNRDHTTVLNGYTKAGRRMKTSEGYCMQVMEAFEHARRKAKNCREREEFLLRSLPTPPVKLPSVVKIPEHEAKPAVPLYVKDNSPPEDIAMRQMIARGTNRAIAQARRVLAEAAK